MGWARFIIYPFFYYFFLYVTRGRPPLGQLWIEQSVFCFSYCFCIVFCMWWELPLGHRFHSAKLWITQPVMFICQKLDNIMDTDHLNCVQNTSFLCFIQAEFTDVDKYQVNKIMFTLPEATVINSLVSGVFSRKNKPPPSSKILFSLQTHLGT